MKQLLQNNLGVLKRERGSEYMYFSGETRDYDKDPHPHSPAVFPRTLRAMLSGRP